MAPLPRAIDARELLDAPAPPSDLEESLRDVARLNRFFGGAWMIRAQVARLLDGIPADRTVTILDVGTGGADLPIALVRWARGSGRRIRVLALDRNDQVLAIARRFASQYPEIVFLHGDGRRLPMKTNAVDVALVSLTLHHLEPSEAAGLLAELHRAARIGFVVNDLIRSRPAYWLVWLATRLFTRSRMSRHDGPLSVRRAYSPDELRALATRAGIGSLEITRYALMARVLAIASDR